MPRSLLSFLIAALLSPWVSADAQTRNIELVNHCSKDIWLSFTAGAAPYKSGASHCSSNAECVDGSECNSVNGICFWAVPVPSNGRFGLSKGEESSISFPILQNDVVWSGNIVACKDGTCAKTEEECDSSGCRVNSTSPVSLVSLNHLCFHLCWPAPPYGTPGCIYRLSLPFPALVWISTTCRY
jgi:hypothetical protein